MKRKLLLVTVCFSIFAWGFYLKNVSAYTLRRFYENGSYDVSGTEMSIQRYKATINGAEYPAYCIDPGLLDGVTSSNGEAAFNIGKLISLNPRDYLQDDKSYQYALAAQYIYEKLNEMGYASSNDNGWSAGTTAFRIITNKLWPNKPLSNDVPFKNAFNIFNSYRDGGAYLNPYNAGVSDGITIANEALSFAALNKSKSYDDLIKSNVVKGVIWNVTNFTILQQSGSSNYELVADVYPNTTNIGSVNYSKFNFEFLNPTAKLIGAPNVSQLDNKGARITAILDGSAWNGQELGASVVTYFCDYNSVGSQAYLFDPQDGTQRFISIRENNKCDDAREKLKIKIDSTNSELCKCDTTNTKYIYTKKKNGSVVLEKIWGIHESAPEGVDASKCPTTCDTITSGKHSCEKPNSSNDNKWYCRESSPGKGDGKVCNSDQFYTECCDTLDPDSDEYKNKCVNCSPTLSIPSTCQDFDDQLNTYFTGDISDINRVSSDCNKEVNQVKNCVIGKNDATGASYEAITDLKDNPYCKVWCDEDYKFDLPTARYTKSGGYFTLSTKITGTRNCYVSSASDPTKPIDFEKLKEDIKKAQAEVFSVTTEYNRWREALFAEEVVEEVSDSNDDCISSHKEESCSTDENGNEHCSSHTVCDAHCDASDSWVVYKYNWSYTAILPDGSTTTLRDSVEDGTGECHKCGCSSRDGKSQRAFFRKKLSEVQNKLIEKTSDLDSLINKYNSCSTWNNNMNFDPKVSFRYDEDYIKQMNGEFEKTSAEKESSSQMYCDGDVDGQYNCQGSATNTPNYIPFTYLVCEGKTKEEQEKEASCKVEKKKSCEAACKNDNNCKASCDEKATNECVSGKESKCFERTSYISSAKWVRKTKVNAATYKPVNNFSTTTQYGTIQYRSSLKDGNGYYLATNLPVNALPIQLRDNTGVFQFKFTFSNIGQSNQNGTLGRLIGNTTSVLTKYNDLPSSKKCGQKGTASGTTDGGYVCYYINNCEDCKLVCDPDCELEPSCPDCPLTCKNCVYDGNGANFSYRPVSLNNLFPNLRNIGYNWDSKSNLKAKVTLSEVEDLGEKIYEKPQYSVRLTPTNLKAIREYNDAAGSYVNSRMPVGMKADDDSAIYCQNETINGINYSVRCRSRFLDLMERGTKYATKFQRVTSNDSSHGGLSDSAWELFTETKYCNDKKCISVDDGVGPSWRLKTKLY